VRTAQSRRAIRGGHRDPLRILAVAFIGLGCVTAIVPEMRRDGLQLLLSGVFLLFAVLLLPLVGGRGLHVLP
jgi:hypothetical protein